MKKQYLLLAILILAKLSFAQTVTVNATNSNVCLGNSSTLTATALPVGYTMTAITRNPSPSAGTHILTEAGFAYETVTGNLNDGRFDNITLPFAFRFFGNVFNSVHVSTNGWVGLGSTNSTSTGLGFALPNVVAPNNVVHAVTADLNFSLATSGLIEYFTEGTYPNRKFVVSYENAIFSAATGTSVSVQVMLYETTNVVEIHTIDCNNTTALKAQGIENAAGTVAYASTGRNNTANWAITGASSSYRFTPDNITFTWSPATTLNTSTGSTVIATPTANTTYTVSALNTVSGTTVTNTVTVNVNASSYTLAGTAGAGQTCQNISVGASSTYYRDGLCKLMATITPAGANPVSNSINTCVQVDAGSTKRGTADLYVARKYDLEPIVNPATSTANITLYYLQSEFDNYNLKATDSGHSMLPAGPSDATAISHLRLDQFHGSGTNPGNYSGTMETFSTATPGFTVVWNVTRSWWEVTVPVTGFSGFYLTSVKLSALPVTLEYFKANKIEKNNQLSWKAACSSGESKFIIERSGDGQHFTVIKSITADQSRCGQPFTFMDESVLNGKNYYRIIMTDMNGKSNISNTLLLVQYNTQYELVQLSPNITSQNITNLKIEAAHKIPVQIIITDNAGRTIKRQPAQLHQGTNLIPVNISNITAGVYLVTAYIAGEMQQTLKLIKQ